MTCDGIDDDDEDDDANNEEVDDEADPIAFVFRSTWC